MLEFAESLCGQSSLLCSWLDAIIIFFDDDHWFSNLEGIDFLTFFSLSSQFKFNLLGWLAWLCLLLLFIDWTFKSWIFFSLSPESISFALIYHYFTDCSVFGRSNERLWKRIWRLKPHRLIDSFSRFAFRFQFIEKE